MAAYPEPREWKRGVGLSDSFFNRLKISSAVLFNYVNHIDITDVEIVLSLGLALLHHHSMCT